MLSIKEAIREEIIAKRDAQTRKQIIAKSLKIKNCLFRLPEFNKAAVVMFYASIKSEVSTPTMIKQALATGKKIVLPSVSTKEQSLLPYLIIDYNTELEKGVWGIPEPKKETAKPISPKEINLVIVPGVVFDQRGYRLGYGKGFYDKFLSKLKTNTPSVGLAFELQIVDKLPHSREDIAVKKIITEKRVINCEL